MKKVLFVATITRHILGFHTPYLKYFKEQGYEVHVASKGNQEIPYCDKHFDLPFERFPLKINNIKTYKQLKKIINENEYEIIHSHTPVGGVLARCAARKVRKKGTKSIYTAHGFHFYKGAPIKNWVLYYPIEKICAKWTDCLITINNEDYEFAKRKLNIKQIEHVYGVGMNTTRFEKELTNEEKLEFRRSLEIKENDIVFSYVAELNKNKNQILLINAINELKEKYDNLKLLLIGDGPLINYYKKIIKDKNLQDNIKVLGRRRDINEILSITNIYLASSLREGLPVNVIEALYKSLPIIARDNRGHRELVKNEINGFIIYNKKELINRIENIINDKKSILIYQNNSKNIAQKYLFDNVNNEIKRIYNIEVI